MDEITRDDYLGTFSVSETCSSSTADYISTITTGARANEVNINNIFDFGDNVVGTIDGSVMTIAMQTDNGRDYEGRATLVNGVVTIRYTARSIFFNQSCTAIYRIQ